MKQRDGNVGKTERKDTREGESCEQHGRTDEDGQTDDFIFLNSF